MLLLWHGALTAAGTRDRRVFGARAGGVQADPQLDPRGLRASSRSSGYAVKFQVPRTYVVVCLPFGLVLLTLSRWSWRQWLLVRRQHGHMTHDAVIVGSVDAVEHLAAVINRNAVFGYRLAGACITSPERPTQVGGVPVIGGVDELSATMMSSGANAVIITSSDAMHPDMVRRLGWDLEGYDIEIIVAPSLANIAGPRVHIRPVAGLPLLHVEQPAYRGAQRWGKVLLDRVGGLGLLLLFSPSSSRWPSRSS